MDIKVELRFSLHGETGRCQSAPVVWFYVSLYEADPIEVEDSGLVGRRVRPDRERTICIVCGWTRRVITTIAGQQLAGASKEANVGGPLVEQETGAGCLRE